MNLPTVNTITVVGMGPGGKAYLTLEAYELLTQGTHVFLRTEQHPVVSYLKEKGMVYTSFDAVYEEQPCFEDVYEEIVSRLIAAAERAPVIYAVPGNAFVAERTVQLLLDRVPNCMKVVHGASFIDAIIGSLAYDPVEGLEILDALSVEAHAMEAHVDRLFIQVYDVSIATRVKLKLMAHYPDDMEVTVVRAAGVPESECIYKMPIFELDHHPECYTHLTSIFVPRGPERYTLSGLRDIMRTLRGENGCPWDREQTHESLVADLIEEAYEVKEAAEDQDDEALVDELGDVLLHVVFHAAIAEEDGYFTFEDIVKAISEKMIRRHPHVFGDAKAETSDAVLTQWQAIKNEEKGVACLSDEMRRVSKSLPALTRAAKIQKKAASVGFDWPDVSSALLKVDEELEEWKRAIHSGSAEHAYEELGDLLFIIANVARKLGLDSELALMSAADKFVRRFAYVENAMGDLGRDDSEKRHEIMEKLWQEAKNIEILKEKC